MAKILIEPAKARNVLNLEDSLESTLKALSKDVDSVRSGLRYKIAGQEQISARLREVSDQITREASATRNYRSALEEIIRRYEQTENSNRDRVASPDRTSVQQGGGSAGSGTDVPDDSPGWHDTTDWDSLMERIREIFDKIRWPVISPIIPSVIPGVVNMLSKDNLFVLSGEVDNKHEGSADIKEMGKDGIFKKANDWEESHQKDLKKKQYYKDLKTGQITEVNGDNETEKEEFSKHNKGSIPIDLRLAGIGAAGSFSVIDKGWSGKTSWNGHEGKVSVAKLEGNADAYLGWGLLGAEVGAGFTAFSVEERAYLGTDDFQAYGKFHAEAGKAEAKASGSIGIVDKEGHFNPSLYAGASAEAIAGEIGGTIGGKVLGTDVGLSGSLNYGIGAHANIGMHDGKLSVDLGATLGVGFDVKVDIDVSGTVDAICGAGEKIWSGVKSLWPF